MSSCVEDILVEAAVLGIRLRLDGEKVKAALPKELDPRLNPVLEQLRNHRDEVRIALQQQTPTARIPRGARLVSWQLKEPPIALNRASVVIDVRKFVLRTLEQLEAALEGKDWLAGNGSPRDLCERLEQVGVLVEIKQATSSFK
jgi:hypothetical protein